MMPVGFGAAMLQGDRWRAALPAGLPISAVFATPLFARAPAGWRARPGTCAEDCCPLLGALVCKEMVPGIFLDK
jgi:hypothetical protein